MGLIFITGASGFIGKRLLNAINCDFRVLSRVKHTNYNTIVCDLQSEVIPDQALNNVSTVIHLAGFAHDLNDASKIADKYYKVNVSATVQLAELSVRAGVKKFVFVSSVKAGGNTSFGESSSEINQDFPEGVYGKTKREAELKLLKIGKESSMNVTIIRPALVYGPGVRGNLQLMLSGIKKGWFPPLPEIRNLRSMIHVDDLVRAILLVAKEKKANGEIFIATDGALYSSRDIYNAMCIVLGKSIPKWSVPKFLFDMASLISPRIKYKVNKLFDNECYSSKKLEKLGFKARKTLKDMNETDF